MPNSATHAKGSPCRCGRCHVQLLCEAGAQGFNNNGGVQSRGGPPCCHCIPKRLCIFIWPSDNEACTVLQAPASDPYGPALKTTFELECTEGTWAGGLGGASLIFYFERDEYNTCWFYLESSDLGYINEFVDGYFIDTRKRVLVPGGFDGYYDNYNSSLREDACLNVEFEFTGLDFSGIEGLPYCNNIRLTTAAADYQPRIDPEPTEPDGVNCVTNRVCITLIDADGQVYSENDVELNEYTYTWTAIWPDAGSGGYDLYAIVSLDPYSAYHGPPLLTVQSSVGDNLYPIEVTCGTCKWKQGFYAEWDFGSYGRVKIRSAGPKGCIDCNCWCRCVCLNYSDTSIGILEEVCWDYYYEPFGFKTTLILSSSETVDIHIYFECDEDTGVTSLVLVHPWTQELLRQSVLCPDIFADWNLAKYPSEETVQISINCNNCGDCRIINIPEACGCPDGLPATLYATFSPAAVPEIQVPPEERSCLGATGVITLTHLTHPESPSTHVWEGFGIPFAGCDREVFITITCGGVEADDTGYYHISSMTITIGEDPEGGLTVIKDFICEAIEVLIADIAITLILAGFPTEAEQADCCNQPFEGGIAGYKLNVTITA